MSGLSYVLEGIFKGFDIAADTKRVCELAAQGETTVLVLKKSGYFAIFRAFPSGILLTILCSITIGCLFFVQILDQRTKILLASFHACVGLGFGILFSLYLHMHKKTYHNYTIIPINQKIIQLQQTDKAFRTLIDYGGTTFFVYGLFMIFYGGILLFSRNLLSYSDIGIFGGLMLLMGRQATTILNFLEICIDLAMDFLLVTKKQMKYYNQTNFELDTETIPLDAIKSISSKQNSTLESLLDYGTISFILEGVDKVGEITLQYMKKPQDVEDAITKLKNDNKKNG